MKRSRGRPSRWDFARLRIGEHLDASIEDEIHFRKAASHFGAAHGCKIAVSIVVDAGVRLLRATRRRAVR